MEQPMIRGKQKNYRGFTLIEILVVLVIIASLLSVVMPKYIRSLDKANDSALRSDLSALRMSIDRFYADKGYYPKNLNDLKTEKYLRQIPVDPITQQANWQLIYITVDDEQVIYDVKSNAKGTAVDGSRYQSW